MLWYQKKEFLKWKLPLFAYWGAGLAFMLLLINILAFDS